MTIKQPYEDDGFVGIRQSLTVPQDEQGHIWHQKVFNSMKILCCMNCGFIRNEHKPNRPCPGPVRVEPRIDNFSTNPSKWSLSKLIHERQHGMPAVVAEWERRTSDSQVEVGRP